MAMIKAVILDDEFHIRDEIRLLLEEKYTNNISIVAEAETIADSILIIDQLKPKLVFLDINFSDGTGFDILSKCLYKSFEVIFITAYDNHAIRAIKAGALDYITKPFQNKEFFIAVDKAIKKIGNERHLDINFDVSNDYYNNNKRLVLNTAQDIFAVNESDILYCESDGNYTTFITTNLKPITVSKYLKMFEEILTEQTFIRCHRSYIVNKEHIQKYSKRGYFVLKNGSQVPVSKERKEYSLKRIFKL